MADGDLPFPADLSGTGLRDALRQVIAAGEAGRALDGVTFIDTEGRDTVSLPGVTEVASVLVLDDALILVLLDLQRTKD